jgi:hypothetical protein
MSASDRSSRGVERQDYLQMSKKGLPSNLTSTPTPKPKFKPKPNTDPNPDTANPPIDAGIASEIGIDLYIDPNLDAATNLNPDSNIDLLLDAGPNLSLLAEHRLLLCQNLIVRLMIGHYLSYYVNKDLLFKTVVRYLISSKL